MSVMKSAGESRRSRRLALIAGASLLGAAAILALIERGDAHGERGDWPADQQFSESDVQLAHHLLQSVRGSNGVLCATVDKAFSTGSWGRMMLPVLDSISEEDAETARWIGHSNLDAGVLDSAKKAMTDTDACVRRIGARLASNVKVAHLDEELAPLLASAAPATRQAAIVALGYSDNKDAAPRVRTMLQDSDANVRLTALWALGQLEDRASEATVISLLKNDRDARVREIAAWALGRIEDR